MVKPALTTPLTPTLITLLHQLYRERLMPSPESQCPVCQTRLLPGIKTWHFRCDNCHYEGTDLQPLINRHTAHELIDESSRETGLKAIRTRNFTTLLKRIKHHKPERGRLLEAGCAHGWFLELASKDFEVCGIEPDQAIFDVVSQKGLVVRQGYFPDALTSNETFDIIVFNDVFEHIPNPGHIIEKSHQHLKPGGLLVLNLPSSTGIFYTLATLLARVNINGPFERLWQKGLPSPHIHYFNRVNLTQLTRRYNFTLKSEGTLPTLSLDGLQERIAYTGKSGAVSKWLIWAVVATGLPFLKILPSDIIYSIYQKK